MPWEEKILWKLLAKVPAILMEWLLPTLDFSHLIIKTQVIISSLMAISSSHAVFKGVNGLRVFHNGKLKKFNMGLADFGTQSGAIEV